MSGGPTSLREARTAAGLSQAALASAAGISRQAVGAIEAGRHRPSVDAALALAAAVGRSVEELFAPAPAVSEAAMGEPVAEGTAVLAARVGARVVHARAGDALAYEGWPRASAVLRDGRPQPLPGADLDGFVLVGCDPALGLASALLPSSGPRRVIALSGSTATALGALRAGRVHAALVHGPPRGLPKRPAGALRLHLARWRVGIANRGHRPRSVAELCDRGTRVVQREQGASSQKAFLAAVAAGAAGGRRVPWPPDTLRWRGASRRARRPASRWSRLRSAGTWRSSRSRSTSSRSGSTRAGASTPPSPRSGNLLRSAAFTERLALIGGYEWPAVAPRAAT